MIKVVVWDEGEIQDFYQKVATDTGYDIRSAEDLILEPGDIEIVSTGLHLRAMEEGYAFDIRPRSSITTKGIVVMNSPGTIDFDYTGEVKVIMANLGKCEFPIVHGDRIAQLVVKRVIQAKFYRSVSKESFQDYIGSDRAGGFGSSGKR